MSRGRYINVPQKISKHVRTQYTHSFLMVLRGITGIYGISAIPSFCILSQCRISYIRRHYNNFKKTCCWVSLDIEMGEVLPTP